MQYKRLFKYDPQCWMPSVEGHVICGHTDFVTSFLYFDTKSWTLIAYCALMLSIVNLRIKVDVTISCLVFSAAEATSGTRAGGGLRHDDRPDSRVFRCQKLFF